MSDLTPYAASTGDWTESDWQRLGGKLEWLQERPDKFKDTPEGAKAMATLQGLVAANPKLDPLAPWLWREIKKGRIEQSEESLHYSSPEGTFRLTSNVLAHWADWFASGSQNPTRRGVDVMQLDVNGVASKIHDWNLHLHAQAEKADQAKLAGGEVVHQLPNGYTIRKLDPEHLDAEGDIMGHCVGGSGYQDAVRDGRTQIYSLRDPQHQPHATVEINPAEIDVAPAERLEYGLRTQNGRALPPSLQEALRRYVETGEDPGTTAADVPALAQQLMSVGTGHARSYRDGPENGNLVQIQGKGNEIPKPEYQAMLKNWFETMPPEQRPKWESPRPWIHNIGAITGTDEYGDPYEDPDGEDGMGGYGEHGDYGLGPDVQQTDYADVLRSLDSRSTSTLNDLGTVDPSDVHAIYQHALSRGEIPQLAQHLQKYDEDVTQPEWDRMIDHNHATADYPGESYEDEPERWESPEHFQNARQGYENWEAEARASHPASQVTNDLYEHLKPHWNGEGYVNEQSPQRTFSHVPEDHQHRETDLYSATDYLEDNRYRRRVTSDWSEV